MPGELLVTGDDFGASREANAAIEACHREGVLTGTSLIATAPAFEDAVARVRSLPELATGLHLVLCDGRAASPPAAIAGLVDADGRFEPSPARAGLRYWWARRALRGALEREMRAQIERFLAAGLPLDHVDGHHHLHLHPVVFDVLAPLLEEYRVRWVRLVHEDRVARSGLPLPQRDAVPAVFAALARRARRLAAARGARGPDRVYGLRASGRLDERELVRLVRALRAPRVEIYLHPSRAGAAGAAEEAALRSPALAQAVKDAGYRLTSSRALARRGAQP
jgi:hopanoid biosynthesis associated protein HpnK